MPRTASVEDAIRNAVSPVVERAMSLVSKMAANLAAEQLARELKRPPRSEPIRGARRRARTEMTRWVADRRARRVPTFVIDATGLKTKKQIVATFGKDAKFEKGKPLPKPQ